MARHRGTPPTGPPPTPRSILWGIVILIGGFLLLLCYIYGTNDVLSWFSDFLDGGENQ